MAKAKQQVENKEEKVELEGKVIDALPETQYLVEVDIAEGVTHQVIGYLSGKMRKHYIKVLVGDKVRIEISPYNPELGRITYKFDRRPRPGAFQTAQPSI